MKTPDPFDLDLTVRSHGFYDLPPWRYDPERRVLGRALRLGGGRTVFAEVAEAHGGLAFRAIAEGRLAPGEAREARTAIATCLALDEDLALFQARAREVEARRLAGGSAARDLPDLRWAVARGVGCAGARGAPREHAPDRRARRADRRARRIRLDVTADWHGDRAAWP